MKKYIRTKDELYDTENLMYRTIKDNKVYQVGWDVEKPTFEADILAEADTIEELCDEFVYIEYKKPRVLDRVITREIKEKGIKVAETIYCHPNWNGIIYGAIWTDKGLIYVAKLNGNGESELI